MVKRPKARIGKKKKELLEKFGFEPSEFFKRHYVRDVEELIDDIPRYVCFQSKVNVIVEINGQRIKFLRGKEYVSTISFYMDLMKNQEMKYNFEPSKYPFFSRFRRYYKDDLRNKSLLVWRYGGLGDLMMIQPLIQFLKEEYYPCKIYFATSPEFMFLLKLWPQGLLDGIFPIPFEADVLDMCDFHLTFEGILERCYESREKPGPVMYAKVAGVELPSHYQPVLEMKDNSLPLGSELINFSNLVVVQYESSTENRGMTVESIANLCRSLLLRGYSVGLINRKESEKVVDGIIDYITYYHTPYLREHIYNLATFSRNIEDACKIVNNALGVIAVDSAFSHISPALGKPTFGLYSSFKAEIRLAYYKNSKWFNLFEETPIECGNAPCFYLHHEMAKCPFKNHPNLPCSDYSLHAEKIADEFDNFLKSFYGEEKLEMVKIKDIKFNSSEAIERSKDSFNKFYYLSKNDIVMLPSVFEVGVTHKLNRLTNTFEKISILKRSQEDFPSVFRDVETDDLNNSSLLVCRNLDLKKVLTLQPVIRYIKSKFPNVKKGLLTNAPFEVLSMFPNDSSFDEIINYGSLNMKKIKEYKYILDLNQYPEILSDVSDGDLINGKDISDFYFRRIGCGDFEKIDKSFALDKSKTTINKFEEIKEFMSKFKKTIVFYPFSTSVYYLMDIFKMLETLRILGEMDFGVILFRTKEELDLWKNDDFSDENIYKITGGKFTLPKNGKFILSAHNYLINWFDVIGIIDISDHVLTMDNDLAYLSVALRKPVTVCQTNSRFFISWYDKISYYRVYKKWNDCRIAPCEPSVRFYKCPYRKKKCLPGCNKDAIDPLAFIEKMIENM